MTINNRLQMEHRAIELMETVEDTAEYFCDEHTCSGEEFYVMMKALCDCKLREFPLDLDELEEDIYND